MEATRLRSRSYAGYKTTEVHKKTSVTALTVFYSVGIIIGIWSLAALVGPLVTVGGPLGLITGYFQAVTGL